MKRACLAAIAACLTLGLGTSAWRPEPATAAEPAEPMIVHNVFFALADPSIGNRKKMIDSCQKLLAEHPGVVFFSAGVVGMEFDREVNDRAFDVALHLVFKNKEAHDKYQTSEKHKQFINENLSGVKRVRVFDSKVNDVKIANSPPR